MALNFEYPFGDRINVTINWLCEQCQATLEEKIRIHARACNILYVVYESGDWSNQGFSSQPPGIMYLWRFKTKKAMKREWDMYIKLEKKSI